VLIPTINPAHITPHAEAFQAVVWHLLVSHPAVKVQATKWESMVPSANNGGENPGERKIAEKEIGEKTIGGRKCRAIFLDRDGVINRAFVKDGKPLPPPTPQDLEILPGVADALRTLKEAGYKLLVVTNQPDVGRGTLPSETLEAMHRDLQAELPLDEIFVCPHSDKDRCECRKPLPGMLIEAARKHNIDLAASYMIGDRWRDVEAGYNAGCKTILIDYGYAEKSAEHEPDLRVKSLREAADWILRAATKGAHS
jgi:D-glycero-D-manno-heptose 1,7-bisphosphate phosphatase